MPYFIRKQGDKYCVVKGTKEDPGEVKKCHPTRKKALAHLAALYVNVEDAQTKDQFLVYPFYRDTTAAWEDRWIAVSTAEIWDAQGDMFTREAMDYDIARAQRTGEYPELRMFHVRGFKLGQCDTMERVGAYAVDQGFWYDTPFAQAVKEVVSRNTGRWKVSRGFYAVEAAGLCPQCGAGLSVGLVHYIVGVPCPTCKDWHDPRTLTQHRFLKTYTYDLSITDVPAVGPTAVAAYSRKTSQEMNDGGQHE